MLTLYHAPNSRSATALYMLHELGEPFELEILDLKKGEHKSADYLAINPMGKVPALKDGAALVTELPAILVYLADKYPRTGLAPAIDAPERGPYLKWMFFNGSCLEPAVMDKFMQRESPPSTAGWGTFDDVIGTLAAGLKPGPWLLGEKFSAADVLIGSALRYMLGFKILPERPEFVAYVERLQARPAFQKALADEKARAGG